MKENWQERLSCATKCSRCDRDLGSQDQRIFSVYDHEPICIECKKKEEQQADYEEVSKRVIGECMADVELKYSDPEGYCYKHFYPHKCE
jgi:hypothetical protein